MASINQSAQFPTLRRPADKIIDPGKVRLGDGLIAAEFPPLRHPDEKTADPGKVRLGDGLIAAEFPRRK
jgi:hypothetical protein